MPNSEEPELETIRLDWAAEGVAVATLDRPDRLNAMTMGMFADLEELAWHIGNLDAARVLILTGAGQGFCAGYDLADAAELPGLSPMAMLARQEQAARALSAVRAVRVPVIAAVNGAVAGGGLALALAADIRIASSAAKFNAAFVRIGLSAGDLGTSWLLPRLVGPALAAEIAYTGRFVEAAEAERIGLVNKVVPAQDLLTEAVAMAMLICANSPAGVQLSKRALQANMEVTSYAAALELENRGQALLTRGEDLPEALEAFRAKRPPVFTGR
ncbi:MAG TPA: enoyl-CoA hydratase-related protein [Streptosporangiaceae bacterium]|nr:enoyl-CoA hydratase-related protein [Streptosporangiaceae bacterium]